MGTDIFLHPSAGFSIHMLYLLYFLNTVLVITKIRGRRKKEQESSLYQQNSWRRSSESDKLVESVQDIEMRIPRNVIAWSSSWILQIKTRLLFFLSPLPNLSLAKKVQCSTLGNKIKSEPVSHSHGPFTVSWLQLDNLDSSQSLLLVCGTDIFLLPSVGFSIHMLYLLYFLKTVLVITRWKVKMNEKRWRCDECMEGTRQMQMSKKIYDEMLSRTHHLCLTIGGIAKYLTIRILMEWFFSTFSITCDDSKSSILMISEMNLKHDDDTWCQHHYLGI